MDSAKSCTPARLSKRSMRSLTGTPGAGQPLQQIPVRRDSRVGVEGARPVGEDGQVPPGGDLGVELPQRPGGGVAGIGEQPLPGLALAAVQVGERFEGHEDLAPDLHDVGRRRQFEPSGHRPDGEHVGGDVLTRHAVAPGRRPHEMPPLVDQRDGQPVELRLPDEGHRLGHEPLQPLAPRLEIRDVECVIERQHRHQVGDRAEGGRAPRPLRRRVGGDQLGVLGLQGQQPPHELVVLGVGDLRLVELVVAASCGTGPAPGAPRAGWRRPRPRSGRYRPGTTVVAVRLPGSSSCSCPTGRSIGTRSPCWTRRPSLCGLHQGAAVGPLSFKNGTTTLSGPELQIFIW